MQTTNQQIVTDYISTIWNDQQLDQLTRFLSPDYKDHSLIEALPPDASGVEKWIAATSVSFEHKTTVEDMLADGDKVFIRITMALKHIGPWRGVAPTGAELSTRGYRLFRLQDGRIAEHWALIDGQVIENTLSNTAHACRIN